MCPVCLSICCVYHALVLTSWGTSETEIWVMYIFWTEIVICDFFYEASIREVLEKTSPVTNGMYDFQMGMYDTVWHECRIPCGMLYGQPIAWWDSLCVLWLYYIFSAISENWTMSFVMYIAICFIIRERQQYSMYMGWGQRTWCTIIYWVHGRGVCSVYDGKLLMRNCVRSTFF